MQLSGLLNNSTASWNSREFSLEITKRVSDTIYYPPATTRTFVNEEIKSSFEKNNNNKTDTLALRSSIKMHIFPAINILSRKLLRLAEFDQRPGKQHERAKTVTGVGRPMGWADPWAGLSPLRFGSKQTEFLSGLKRDALRIHGSIMVPV